MRLFIGLPLDIKTKNKLLLIQNELKLKKVTGNFTLKNNLHMTMAFLGEVSDDKLDILINLVNEINDSVTVELEGIDLLRDIVIYKVNKTSELVNLHKRLIEKLKEIGFNLPSELTPHITLIRKYQSQNDVRKLINDIKMISTDNKLTLFESKRINNELVYIKKS